MKKTIFALAIISLAAACNKDNAKEEITDKTYSTIYLQVEAVDNDNITTTVSPIVTVKIKN